MAKDSIYVVAIFSSGFVNKFKEIQLSMQGESLSLLKPSLSVSLQARPSLSQLRTQAKKNEAIISQVSKRVENYRQQMKNLSKTVNSLIDKQMKKPTKQRPSFHPSYSNPKLNTLFQQKNKLFLEIQALKLQIKDLQVEQPQAVVKQVQSYEANLAQLNIEFNRTQKNKSMLSRELEENRLKLQELSQNSCLIDLSKKEAEFQGMLKQCKKHEKDINQITADQYQLNSYYLFIKSSVEREVIEQNIAVEIDEGEMRELIDQINSIYDERKQVERQNLMKIKNTKDMIAQLQKNIKNNQIQLRQFQNQLMRAEIQSRRIKSLSNIKKQYSTQKTIFQKIYAKQQQKEKKKIQQNPEVKKVEKRIINRIYMIQKDDANCIYIGQWQNIGKNLSDKPQTPTNFIEKVKSVSFLLNNGKLIGFKSYYVDKSGLQIEGRQLKSHLQSQIRVQVNFQEVTQLQYSRKSQDFYMRFIFVNGSWKEIGQRGTQVQKINLEHYLLKGVEAEINQQQGFIQAFKFILEQKNQIQKGLGDIADRTSSQMSYSNVESIGKRRVILKGKSLKKIKEQPIIDHRLMLNKKF